MKGQDTLRSVAFSSDHRDVFQRSVKSGVWRRAHTMSLPSDSVVAWANAFHRTRGAARNAESLRVYGFFTGPRQLTRSKQPSGAISCWVAA